MEMMRLLLLLAAATRAKELSFGRDGVELFRRVFDEDAGAPAPGLGRRRSE